MSAERIEEDMTDAGKTGPRVAKGGVFAPADVKLVQKALIHLMKNDHGLPSQEFDQAANLLHRLGRII